MAQFPNNPQQFNPQQGMTPVPLQSRRRWRFRWGLWVGAPLACLAAALYLQAIGTPVFDFGDVMEAIGVPFRAFGSYTGLCVLGLTLIAIVAVLRVWRSRGR